MENETATILDILILIVSVTAITFMFIDIYKGIVKGDEEHHTKIMSRLNFIIVLCIVTALLFFLDSKIILGCIWVFNVSMWCITRQIIKNRNDKKIRDFMEKRT